MKKVILFFAIAISTVAIAQVPKKETTLTAAKPEMQAAKPAQSLKPAPAVKWSETVHDFGDISQNTPVTHKFTFVNNTKDIVIITNVKPSCGCTAANFTKTPIKPGDTAFVEAKYDARAAGAFNKSIGVQFGEDFQQVSLAIKGKVEAAAAN